MQFHTGKNFRLAKKMQITNKNPLKLPKPKYQITYKFVKYELTRNNEQWWIAKVKMPGGVSLISFWLAHDSTAIRK